MGVAALILAAGAILSRFMGLIRDKIISWQFGAGGESDLYFAAFVIPDLINYLLAGGFMSITVIPLLARRFREDEEDAWRLFSAIFLWMGLGAILLTLLAAMNAERLADLVAPGFDAERRERLAFFMRLILPAQVFFLSGAAPAALLHLRRQFAVPALSPLVYNGCIILGGVTAPLVSPDAGMTGYCVGVTVGAALGAFALPLAMAARHGLRLIPNFRHAMLPAFAAVTLPLMLGQTVVSLDEQFCRVFGSLAGDGAVSLLNYARRLTQAPIALVGQAASVASYPFLVSLLARDDRAGFDATLNTALRAGICLIIPCAVWMIVAAEPVMAVIFQGGRFGAAETAASAPLLRLMLAAAPFWIFHMIMARAFYAGGDTLTPAVTGTILTLAALPVYRWWAVPQGAQGIALVSAVSVGLYCLWLGLIWRRRHGGGAFSGMGGDILRAALCALPAGALAWFCQEGASGAAAGLHPILAAAIRGGAGGIAFAAVFLGLAFKAAPGILAPLKRFYRGSAS